MDRKAPQKEDLFFSPNVTSIRVEKPVLEYLYSGAT